MVTIYLLLVLSAVIFWSLGYASGHAAARRSIQAGEVPDPTVEKWP